MKKTAIETFIEKAREGGYYGDIEVGEIEDGDGHGYEVPEIALLDPKAWQAVGRVEGWSEGSISIQDPAEKYAVGMVIALFEGKTTEEYLTTLFV